jgi:hypothetical protein
MSAWRRIVEITLLCGAGTLASGCGEAAPQDARRAHGVMTVLGLEYGDYLAANRNSPPQNVSQFRSFVASRPQKMTEYRVNGVDELFTSPRDGQPIQVVCGLAKPVVDAQGYPLAAYEAVGTDGKRLVANARGGVSELTDEQFAQTFPNQGR